MRVRKSEEILDTPVAIPNSKSNLLIQWEFIAFRDTLPLDSSTPLGLVDRGILASA